MRSFKSSKLWLWHRMAMISDAAVMLNPPSRGTPPFLPPNPSTIWRRARSFMSMTRFQEMVRGSRRKDRFLDCKLLSINAASRLLAFSTAEKSPVKWRLMSSMGMTCECPPPVAPPLMPKTGPNDGSRRAAALFNPIWAKPSVKPTVTVVFPSPAGVGEMAVTSTKLACFSRSGCSNSRGNLALFLP